MTPSSSHDDNTAAAAMTMNNDPNASAAMTNNNNVVVIPKTTRMTLTFKSDLRKSQFDSMMMCSGILHAIRVSTTSSSSREDHVYVWICNYDTIDNAAAYLANYGFVERNHMQFIPYTSRGNWVNTYPHAFPYVHCDQTGHVTGFPFWSPNAAHVLEIPPEIVHVAMQPSTAAAMMMMNNHHHNYNNNIIMSRGAVGKNNNNGTEEHVSGGGGSATNAGRGGSTNNTTHYNPSNNNNNNSINTTTRLPDSLLTHKERNQLHKEMYKYFVWLRQHVQTMENTDIGKRAIKKAGLRASDLLGIINRFEYAFKFVEGSGEGNYQTIIMPHHGDVVVDDNNNLANPTSVKPMLSETSIAAPKTTTTAAAAKTNATVYHTLPLLEQSLQHEMSHLVHAEHTSKKQLRLQKVKTEKAVILARPTVASSSSSLKRKRTEKEKDGGGILSQNNNNCGQSFNGQGIDKEDITRPKNNNNNNNNSWQSHDFDAMFQQLVAYKEKHGNTSILLVDSIEDAVLCKWTYGLRTMMKRISDGNTTNINNIVQKNANTTNYFDDGKDDENDNDDAARVLPLTNNNNFQLTSEQIQRLNSIGFDWSTGLLPPSTIYCKRDEAVSWDARFHQLVKFRVKHGHFDVPNPEENESDAAKESYKDLGEEEMNDQCKFYKWVDRLHSEYRAYEKGTVSKLNDKRVEKLLSIGFVFHGPKTRGRKPNQAREHNKK